jgi:phosphopantetheine adenylyltransferase/dephospho-CoA kinase
LYISPFAEDQEGLTSLQNEMSRWKRTKFLHIDDMDFSSDLDTANIPSVSNNIYQYGVLGGTFDDIHVGHKLLLSTASTLCHEKVLIGITHEDLLKKKKLVELLQSYEKRKESVSRFLKIINPKLSVEIVPISDPIGPSGTDPDLELLIVSEETVGAVKMINNARAVNGFTELPSYCVDLITPKNTQDPEKVSSSNLRREMLGKLVDGKSITWLRRHSGTSTLSPSRLPYVIGLTGGICSGKSTISNYLKDRGAETIDCDIVGHQVYQPDGPAYELLIGEFGKIIVSEDGSINRRELGKIVFSDESKMKKLNEIVWPCIANTVKTIIEKSSSELIVVEAAVMLEAGWQNFVDEVWVMTVSPEEAIKRLTERNKLSLEDAEKRLNSQMTNTERCTHADIIVCSDWEHSVTQCFIDKACVGLAERIKYFKVCQNKNSIEERWKFVASNACCSSKDPKWLTDILRSEKSLSFLKEALDSVDETLHLSKEKHLVLYMASFFLATTVHVQNSSIRAAEAMFKMFCQGNDVKKELADEVMRNLRVSSNLLKKPVPCTEFNALFRDIWMKARMFCLDEGDKRILPSCFTTEEHVIQQTEAECELILRLLEGSKFIFKTDYFRTNYEAAAKDRLKSDLERLAKDDSGEIMESVRGNIGYCLQEY